MNSRRLGANFNSALEAILANKMRSMLTGLGIIFGVAAVITMLAIGSGAQLEILKQIELVGVNNIEIKPIVPQEEVLLSEEEGEGEETGSGQRYSKGLDLQDARSIAAVLPTVAQVSPEIILETSAIGNGRRRSVKLVGIENQFFELANLSLRKGQLFSENQILGGAAVCIVGSAVAQKLFPGREALGQKLKVGNQYLHVVGVMQPVNVTQAAQENLGIRDYNMDIYTPINTVLVRYRNRALLKAGGNRRNNEQLSAEQRNYHQIDRLLVRIANTDYLASSASVIARMLTRTHNQNVDFEIIIPQQLLAQQQRTKDIFNLVLSAIAGISLLVGGIGIMNIMLASVLERTREIGTRMAIGAQKQDIIQQFLLEALLISLSGGLLGVALGVAASFLISEFADIETLISPWSILLSFGVASATGLVFGLSPARKAAEKNPVESLRYE